MDDKYFAVKHNTAGKMSNVMEVYSFKTNVGSPQGDGLSGPLFEVYFEDALRRLRSDMKRTDPSARHRVEEESDHSYARLHNSSLKKYSVRSEKTEAAKIGMANDHSYSSNAKKHIQHDHEYFNEDRYGIPGELLYADDADFNTLDVEIANKLNRCVADILEEHNLLVNNDKTEKFILKRGKAQEELWRNVLKLGSLLGDVEDIARRKQLAMAAMNKLENVWFSNYSKIGMERRIQLFNAPVMHVLTYNSCCWGLRRRMQKS